MTKNLRFLLAIVAVVTMLSSCKKAAVTDTSILTGHKWVLTGDVVSYSDSVVTHNQIHTSPTCLDTTWFEFHDYTTNSAIRALYQYTSIHCTNASYNTPMINVGSWDIDRDNNNVILNYSGTNVLNGTWLAIKTINSNSLVLTAISEEVATYTGTYPNQVAVYHTITETWTFGTM